MSEIGPNDPGQSPTSPQSAPTTGHAPSRVFEALFDFYFAAGVDGLIELDPVDAFAFVPVPMPAQANAATTGHPPKVSPAKGSAATSSIGGNTSVRPDPHQPMQNSRAGVQGSSKPSTRTPPSAKSAESGGISTAAVIPGEEAVAAAREAAKAAQSLEELRQILATFEGCNLRLSAKNLVFGSGDPQARIMFVGEPPDKDEDQSGKPLAGRPGQLFERILAAVGLNRQSVYIANVIPWRPPGGRTPSPQEVEICKPFIARQIELVEPEILVFLGGASADILAGASEGIVKLRGRWMPFPFAEREIRAIATLPPAHLLRYPAHKGLVWRDFLEIRSALAKT